MKIKRKWQIPKHDRIAPSLIAAAGDPVIAGILYRRGCRTAEEITAFLQHDGYSPCDFAGHPLLLPIIQRVEQALSRGEKITVYGDYDVDGITSTVVWMEALRCLGADAGYYLPDRFEEGYGVHAGSLRNLAASGTRLIITCDCGIANFTEIEEAKAWGLDVVVTDHHELPPKLPAVPVFNPKMLPPEHPAYMLPGVGVSFIAVRELLRRAGKKAFADTLLEMVALGIIADVVPVTKDNRWYLKQGLIHLLGSERPGVKALLEISKIHPLYGTEEDIAFQVIPRLNAAGRLASASLAVDLLLAADRPAAQKKVAELNSLNEARKKLCDQIQQEASAQLGDRADDLAAIALYKQDWHEGVMGIVAGRLAEQYRKPALLMTRKENGLVTGSARSGGPCNIFACLSECQELLLKYGGHEGAAGFSLLEENVGAFIERINTVVGALTEEAADEQPLQVDALLAPEQVTMELYSQIRALGPYGPDHPQPVFLIEGEPIINQPLKLGSPHRRLRFRKNGQTADAIWWHSGADPEENGQFLARLRLNIFRDNVNVQLDILDVASGEYQDLCVPADIGFCDMRGRSEEELQRIFPQALFFGEGSERPMAGSRLALSANKTLVMLTVPCQTAVWAELLQTVNPQLVVVAWDMHEPLQERVCEESWRQLMGVVKFSLRAFNGILTPRRVAARLGWTGEMVTCGLLALGEAGLINIQPLDGERMCLSLQRTEIPNLRNLRGYRDFMKMLAEAEAYRSHVRSLPVAEIYKILLGAEKPASIILPGNFLTDNVSKPKGVSTLN